MMVWSLTYSLTPWKSHGPEEASLKNVSGGDGIPGEIFQIRKDDAMKDLTQNASKFGKLFSGHWTGKGLFSFQSQRKAMPKNAQTTAQWHSSHLLAKGCSKFSRLGFNSIWTKNSQMLNLDLEKAEAPEIKFWTSIGSSKKQEFQKKPLLLLYWLHQSLSMCWSQQTIELKGVGIPDHLTCPLRNLYAG